MPLAASSRNVHTYNDTVLTPEQVAQVLWQAGIRDTNAIAQLIPIAQRESGFRAGVQGTTQPRGAISGDMGLFQINWGAHGQNLLNAGIIQRGEDLYDPVINARAAAYLSGNGNPQRMLQLWGVRNGTWAGTNGTLPTPNYGVVQNAQRGGLLGQNYTGGGTGGTGGAPPGYGGGGAVPPPGVSTTYYDQLYGNLNAQMGLNVATTQNDVDYAKQQQAFANQLSGYQTTALGYQQEQLDLENAYQNDVALLNANLSKTQQATNLAEWRQIATNVDALRKLADKGMQGDKEYYAKSLQLEKDIRSVTDAWIKKQGAFNQTDYDLAKQAIQNVVTTEAARWAEVQRASGAETDLAKQKQSFIAQGAQETYGQALAEAQFVEKEQRREAKTEAITRGAMTSRGYGEDLAAFAEQRGLAGSAATISRDDVMRMSQNQLASELEQINQAYNQGQISYDDMQRQTVNAQGRAKLTFDQRAGELGYQGQQNWLNYKGNVQDAQNQWRNQYLGYQQNVQNLSNQRTMGQLGYQQQAANLTAQQQQAARQTAYNNALYGINTAGLANTGRIYGTQLAQSQAGTQYGIDQTILGGAMTNSQLAQQGVQIGQDQYTNIAENAGQGGGYVSPRRVYTPPITSSRAAAPGASRTRTAYN